MKRPCDTCGNPYEAKSPRSRFCSDLCRARNKGKPKDAAEVVHVTDLGDSRLYRVAEAELTAAGRVDSSLGQAALALARVIGSPRDTGSAQASAVREFRATMSAALQGVSAAADPVDEFTRRRNEKLGTG